MNLFFKLISLILLSIFIVQIIAIETSKDKINQESPVVNKKNSDKQNDATLKKSLFNDPLAFNKTPSENKYDIKLQKSWKKHLESHRTLMEKFNDNPRYQEIFFNNYKKEFERVENNKKKSLTGSKKKKYNISCNKFAQFSYRDLQSTILFDDPDKEKILKNFRLKAELTNKHKIESESQNKSKSHFKVKGPTSINWCNHGFCNPVGDQGPCACCTNFATAEVIAIQYNILKRKKLELSVQNTFDCTFKNTQDSEGRTYGNNGCKGGFSERNMDFIINNGIMIDEKYPYVAHSNTPTKSFRQKCKHSKKRISEIKLAGYNEYFDLTVEQIIKLLEKGPVHSYFYASREFMRYSGGVYDNEDEIFQENCSKQINHAVVIVGYDRLPDNSVYWIVKNSWGPDWGENGYFNIKAGKNIACFESHLITVYF